MIELIKMPTCKSLKLENGNTLEDSLEEIKKSCDKLETLKTYLDRSFALPKITYKLNAKSFPPLLVACATYSYEDEENNDRVAYFINAKKNTKHLFYYTTHSKTQEKTNRTPGSGIDDNEMEKELKKMCSEFLKKQEKKNRKEHENEWEFIEKTKTGEEELLNILEEHNCSDVEDSVYLDSGKNKNPENCSPSDEQIKKSLASFDWKEIDEDDD